MASPSFRDIRSTNDCTITHQDSILQMRQNQVNLLLRHLQDMLRPIARLPPDLRTVARRECTSAQSKPAGQCFLLANLQTPHL